MLVLESEIYFDTPDQNKNALKNDLDTKNILRPAINFGNGNILTGTVIANKSITKFMRGIYYTVKIEMPLIDNEAYNEIYNLLKRKEFFPLQIASKKIGKIVLLDWNFKIG